MTKGRPSLAGKNCFLFGLILAAAGCAGSHRALPRAAAPPTPEQRAQASATEAFTLGREAALSGDFACAHGYFEQAIQALRPAGPVSPASPETLAFSAELYQGILRYEALAAPPEDTASGEDTIAPELRRIEAPAASEEAMTNARNAIASDDSGVTFDMPIVVNDSVLKIIATFQGELHDIIARGLARSGRYLPMIHRVFREEGIPTDLAEVAMIESSFIPNARSRMAAHGIWQFMPRTGRQYGLHTNSIMDERSDPEKATRAAAKHLAYLHDLFHDWFLALAAYNAGEGKILRAIERTGLNDFWQLAASGLLRAQTANYVPAVIAATLIAKNPKHYGFDVEYEAPLEYETVRLDRPVRLRDLADEEKVPLADLERLNPELRAGVTPREREGYDLKVPIGMREDVLMAFASAPTARVPFWRRHAVRRGETLASVARRYRVSLSSLAAANSLSPHSRVRRGRVLLIPERQGVRVAARRAHHKGIKAARLAPRAAGRPAGVVTRSYRVRGGDTLYRIARRHGTTVESLMAANDLASPAIRPGDRLKIPARSLVRSP